MAEPPLPAVDLKIVYDGPSGAGKTVNLRQIAHRLDDTAHGPMITLHEPGRPERTMLMDLLPLSFTIPGRAQVRVRLYATPGGAPHRAARRLVREGADAVVFVAEARRAGASAANRAWAEMRDDFTPAGRKTASSAPPVVVQWNRPDPEQPGAAPPGDVHGAVRVVPACAAAGQGVLETLESALRSALRPGAAATATLGEGGAEALLGALRTRVVGAGGAS